MKFSSFLKMLAFSFIRIPWTCWEFWILGFMMSMFAMTGTASAPRKVACTVSVFVMFSFIVCLAAVQAAFGNRKVSDDDADRAWKSLFRRLK